MGGVDMALIWFVVGVVVGMAITALWVYVDNADEPVDEEALARAAGDLAPEQEDLWTQFRE